MKIKFKNFLGTIESFFRNDATTPRNYQFQDRDGTIADDTDLASKQDTTMGANPLSLTGTAAGKTNTIGFSNTGGVSINSSGSDTQSEVNLSVSNNGNTITSNLDIVPGAIILTTPVAELAGGSLSVTTANSIATRAYVLANAGTGTVESVTGDGVDSADPDNPVINITNARTLTTTGTIAQTDNLHIIYLNGSSPFNVTVDALTLNSQVNLVNVGTSIVTLVNGAGVTFSGSATINPDETATILYRTATAPEVLTGGTIPNASPTIYGLAKLYTTTGTNTDGTIDQNGITNALATKQTTALTSANILVGNVSNVATSTAMSGDVTINNTGVTAIGAGKVTGTMIANGTIDLTTKVTGVLPIGNGGTGGSSPWLLPSGGTLTGPNNIIGSTTNTFTMDFPSVGTTLTDGAGIYLRNTTAAASGLQQSSPLITFEGRGWKTNATAASQIVKFILYGSPTQGTANPTGFLRVASSINGAGNVNVFGVGSAGIISIIEQIQSTAGGATFGGVGTGSSGSARVAVTSQMSVTGSAQFLSSGENATGTTAVASIFSYTGSMNSTSSNAQPIFNASFPVAQAVAVTGFYYNPSTPNNISGANLAFHATSGNILLANGNLTLGTAGNGILIKEGTNATSGTGTLVTGTATISTTKVTANSRIYLTVATPGGTQGFLSYSKSAGTSFTVNSTSATETSTFNWLIIEPAP